MKKYQFRLARVQRVRAVEEDLARARFGEAELEARNAEDRAEARRRDIDRAIDDLRGLQGSPKLAPTSVIAALSLVDEARATWRDADGVARGLRARAEEMRRAWMERRRDVEGLERLDGRARDEFRREQEHAEVALLDEVASQRDARARAAAATRNSRPDSGEELLGAVRSMAPETKPAADRGEPHVA